MTGEGFNFGSSVIKRTTENIDSVDNKLRSSGWTKTAEALNGKVRYFESSGINITAVDGPRATIVMPSGPVRGRIFGSSGFMAGMGAKVLGGLPGENPHKDEGDEVMT